MDIALKEISRSFGETKALHDMSMTLPAGRITGFVGNNGAGKSTAIRILVGLLEADRGQILVNGQPARPEDRRRIGYVPEERGLYQQDKVAPQLTYMARTFGLTKQEAAQAVEQGLSRFGISHYADTKLADLSLGNQQRVQIICALLADPDTLILDEPFSGLDPEAVGELADILRTLAHEGGKTVLFSSHQLDVVENISDRVVFIKQGQVLVEDSIDSLTGGQDFSLTSQDSRGLEHRHTAHSPSELAHLIGTLTSRGHSLVDITSEKRGLIHVFRQYSSSKEEE